MGPRPLRVDWSAALHDIHRLAAFEPVALTEFMDAFEAMAATGFNLGRRARGDQAAFRYVSGNIQALYDLDRPYLFVVLVEDARQLRAHF